MSAKGRGTKPIANDAYPTPPWVVWRLLEVVGTGFGYHWLEPASGTGAITRAVDLWQEVYSGPSLAWKTVDIVSMSPNRLAPSTAHYTLDFLGGLAPSGPFDVAITNPPFSLAFEFAKKMTAVARHSFLLTRLSILEAGKRSGRLKWLRENTPDVYVLPDRPCFSHSVRCTEYCTGAWPIAWDAPTEQKCPTCGAPAFERKAGTDATGYCWLHWDSSKLPRTSGLITHLAETPKSERVDRVVGR